MNLYKLLAIKIILILFLQESLLGQGEKDVAALREMSHEIHSGNAGDFADLDFLTEALEGRSVVLLGEFTHGAREINLVKNRLIKYLHERQGFDVLLMESGVGELIPLNTLRNSLSPQQMLSAGLTGPWRTAEYLQLMEYLKATELAVAGFDVQRTGQVFPLEVEKTIGRLDPEFLKRLEDVETRFGDLNRTMERDEFSTAMMVDQSELTGIYRGLTEVINLKRKELEEAGISPVQLDMYLRTFQNRIDYLKYYLRFKMDGNYHRRWAMRDSIMAANILWLSREVFPGKKLIISAHNYHISRSNERELVMGEILAKEFGNRMYAVGIFGEQGEYADNSGNPKVMDAVTGSNDIKAYIALTGKEASFVDFPEGRVEGDAWLYGETIVNDSFIDLEGSNSLVLKNCFDGLILINEISPPGKLD